MPKHASLHTTNAEAVEEIRRALEVARAEGYSLSITLCPEATTGHWLVEIQRYRPWEMLSSAVRDALATWEKTSIRTIAVFAAKMDAVRKALADVESGA